MRMHFGSGAVEVFLLGNGYKIFGCGMCSVSGEKKSVKFYFFVSWR